jgi:dienelactone hydrolase
MELNVSLVSQYFLMKRYFFITACLIAVLNAYAQKSIIDSNAYGKWDKIGGAIISNNGKYVMYSVENRPIGENTLVLKASNGEWQKEIIGANLSNATIAPNSKQVYYLVRDTLCVLTLGNMSKELIPNTDSYSMTSNGEWLIIKNKDTDNKLFIRNTRTGFKKYFLGVSNYLLSEENNVLVLNKTKKVNGEARQLLSWFSFSENKEQTIWEGKEAGDFHFDKLGQQFAFKGLTKLGDSVFNAVWYYKKGTEKANLIIDDRSDKIPRGFKIRGIKEFGEIYNQLFILLAKMPDKSQKKVDEVNVDVWSYHDPLLQSLQFIEDKSHAQNSYLSVLSLDNRELFRLEQEGDFQVDKIQGNYLLVNHRDFQTDRGESNWNSACRTTPLIISIKDGRRNELNLPKNNPYSKISPGGKYLVYYDPIKRSYFSYCIASKRTENISENVHLEWRNFDIDLPDGPLSSGEFKAWSADGDAIFISDHFDIWRLSLSGKKSPVNITNGFGKSNNMSFDFADDRSMIPIRFKENLTFIVYDRNTNENGYYEKKLGSNESPKLLTKGKYVYYISDGIGQRPIKAHDANVYILTRQTASESPNFFVTTDFKKISRLSNVHPEINYNWLTTELITWQVPNLGTSKGILYKPENFNPLKKYPVIFWYYERNSQKLNKFLTPDFNVCNIDIPTFVSQGYIVFVPDIHYEIGSVGSNALNTLVSAANHLANLPFVDASHLGLQGHSFGGYQTNYIVTHTNIFAAAMSAAGVVNATSFYGFVGGGGTSSQPWCEVGQGRFGFSLCERPDEYIENSPIFSANKVITPILLMANKNDPGVPFDQGLSFFIALRRYGKRAWLLQYDYGEHWVIGKYAAADFTTRVSQFFDHYLKNAPAPKWMTQGIPASKKGIYDGFDLEPQGVLPRPNLLTPEAQRNVDSLQNRKPITITIN